jgi:beta-N-acetylhexosaminidase
VPARDRARLGLSAGGLAAVLVVLAAPASAHALTARRLAGERVVYSYAGPTPPAPLLARIRAGEAAGVIFFGENIASPAQLARVARRLQRAARHSPDPRPLLLMTDQEGGVVRRLPGAPTESAKQIGASAHPVTAARRAGRGAARNLRDAGLDVNLAPVLDVFRAPGDFIDRFGRSFGMDPSLVARAGTAFATAEQAAGVDATAKHFPGLGAATRGENTDLGPVTLDVPLQQLRGVDELPYRSAIASGVRVVMASWAVYPALDAQRPAGLSPTVIGGELRDRLGFGGVTITDALEAGALRPFGGTGRRAVLAARAGMDLILCSARDVAQGDAAASALARALRRGDLAERGFRAAVRRVDALRSRSGG